jgi:hypothetical protein
MNYLAFLTLLFLLVRSVGPVAILTGRGTAVSCTPPTMTYRWSVRNPGIGCTAGACVNGGTISSLPSSVGSNPATNSSSGRQPIYTTNVINGQPAALFNGVTNSEFLALTTPNVLPQSGSATFYAVIEPTSTCASTNCAMFGGAATNNFEYRVNTSSKQQMLQQQNVSIGIGTATISTTAFTTVAATYNFGTGAWALFTCSGGTCSSDGSGTGGPTSGWANSSTYLGAAPDIAEWFSGYIAEWGYLNSISTAGIGAYSSCQYGI